MSFERTLAILSDHPFFSALEREALRVLAFNADRLELPPGQIVFQQGTPADSGYLLLRGELELQLDREDQIQTLGLVAEGGLLGEIALLCPTQRPSTAVARSRVEVLKITRTNFRRVLEQYPRGAEALRQRMAERLLALSASLQEVRGALMDLDKAAG